MVVIAAVAVAMGLHRLMTQNPPWFALLITLIVQITTFAVYDWLVQKRKRRFSKGRSTAREARAELIPGVQERVG
jgi:purine-cytosine permease-like protein